MKTVLKDWYIVNVFECVNNEKLPVGRVLWGKIVLEETAKFYEQDFICSSRIVVFNQDSMSAVTSDGTLYMLNGPGKEVDADSFEMPLLRQGVSPVKVQHLKHALQLDGPLPDPIINPTTLKEEMELKRTELKLNLIHGLSYRNEVRILESARCGCYHCMNFFQPEDIDKWIIEPEDLLNSPNKTAKCPICNVDAVIPECGFTLSTVLLNEMHTYLFN